MDDIENNIKNVVKKITVDIVNRVAQHISAIILHIWPAVIRIFTKFVTQCKLFMGIKS